MYSVIIPSIGRINFINQLLESIYNQTVPPEEIIILLDKNSKCENQENLITKKYKCKVLFCENLTTAQKRNFGVINSKTNIILFSDDDDIWESKKAEFTLKSLKKSQVVCHGYSKFDSIKKKPIYNFGEKFKEVSPLSLLHGNNIWGGGSGIAARKEILLSIPFNNDSYSEDYDWWIKIILAEIKISYIPISLVKYRVHDSNMTSNLLNIFKYNTKLFNKLMYKSLILFLTFISGTLRLSFSTLIKSLIKLLLKLTRKYF